MRSGCAPRSPSSAICYGVTALFVLSWIGARLNEMPATVASSTQPRRKRRRFLELVRPTHAFLFHLLEFQPSHRGRRDAARDPGRARFRARSSSGTASAFRSCRASRKCSKRGEVRFSSLHNFCPLPVEVMGASPDCYTFSARLGAGTRARGKTDFADDRFRGAARRAVRRAASAAKVPIKPVTEPLIALAKAGEMFSREYVQTQSQRGREARSGTRLVISIA